MMKDIVRALGFASGCDILGKDLAVKFLEESKEVAQTEWVAAICWPRHIYASTSRGEVSEKLIHLDDGVESRPSINSRSRLDINRSTYKHIFRRIGYTGDVGIHQHALLIEIILWKQSRDTLPPKPASSFEAIGLKFGVESYAQSMADRGGAGSSTNHPPPLVPRGPHLPQKGRRCRIQRQVLLMEELPEARIVVI
ncbi:hypothetical protein CRG98_015987 [Punica granatum]|uniref:Uncharacterized protein n=1 Tax=Punica granatum TaxID=22663 RepID=A0A2I0K4Y6_PUNGR|nr:hypothetical protein CRG98_015987 [Punica granatum]